MMKDFPDIAGKAATKEEITEARKHGERFIVKDGNMTMVGYRDPKTNQVTLTSMLEVVEPPTADASRYIDDLVRRTLFAHMSAIEACLVDLVHSGTVALRISLEQHPDGTTRILVDHVPVKEFRVSVSGDGAPFAPRGA